MHRGSKFLHERTLELVDGQAIRNVEYVDCAEVDKIEVAAIVPDTRAEILVPCHLDNLVVQRQRRRRRRHGSDGGFCAAVVRDREYTLPRGESPKMDIKI